MAQSKVYPDAASALKGLTFDGMTVMCGGFGLSGNPENLIAALKDDGVKNITIISNNCGADGLGLWVLLNNSQIKKMISSYVGENKLFEELYLNGKLELELTPQGTLGGAHPRRRRGHSRLLYPHRRRHRGGGGQAHRGVRRSAPMCASAG